MSDVVLKLENITRSFGQGASILHVLRGASLELKRGELVALTAPSGAGKSTLLHIAGLLEKPNEGDVVICGQPTRGLADSELTGLRSKSIGFVYQFHHLLPEFTALENVMMPQLIAGAPSGAAKKRATDMLGELGLSARLTHRPAELSGGEQQRVAIARALANAPKILLADEPTGNLDPRTADHVFDALLKTARGAGLTALIVTHNFELARRMDKHLTVQDGQILAFSS